MQNIINRGTSIYDYIRLTAEGLPPAKDCPVFVPAKIGIE